MRKIKIAILGFGTIGSQFYQYLQSGSERIRESCHVETEVTKIYVSNIRKKRKIKLSNSLLTDQGYDAIDSVDLVVECIGGNGAESARDFIRYALHQGKPVIISSKKCLALYGKDLFEEATDKGVPIFYDACVGGGIPISRNLREMGKCEKIKKIYGICNATSNFILEEMTMQNVTFQEALLQAQKEGIAENDPTEDVDGYDALYKAIILAGVVFGTWITVQSVKPESLQFLAMDDLNNAKENGCIMKQIFEVKQEQESVVCQVENRWIKQDSLIACIKGSNNLIIVDSSEAGERAFYGKGAGAGPTASAMFDDLFNCLMLGILKP